MHQGPPVRLMMRATGSGWRRSQTQRVPSKEAARKVEAEESGVEVAVEVVSAVVGEVCFGGRSSAWGRPLGIFGVDGWSGMLEFWIVLMLSVGSAGTSRAASPFIWRVVSPSVMVTSC